MITNKNKTQIRSDKKIREILDPDERLIVTASGYLHQGKSNKVISFGGQPPFNLFTVFYVGLTTKHLILREENLFGKIRKIQRIPLEFRQWAFYNPSNTLDILTVAWGDNNQLDLLIFKQHRPQTETIANVFGVKQAASNSIPQTEIHSKKYSPLSPLNAFWDQEGLSLGIQFIIIVATGFLVAFGIDKFLDIAFPANRPEIAPEILRFVLFFVWGFLGIVIIKKKEIPGLITIRGKLAVAQGLVLTTFMWFMAFWALFDAVKK